VSRVAVVVVHYGDPGPTLDCLAALHADPSEVERTVVVVDNTRTFTEPTVSGARLLPQPHNPGYGEGANRGVAALEPGSWEVVVALNNDVEVLPGFLDAAASAAERPRVGAASGPMWLDHERSVLWYAGGGVNFVTGTVWQSRSERDAERERTVGFLPGTALAVTAEAWRAVGGFDPRYFLYHEDLDLCLRLRREGYQLLFAPGMAVVHHLGSSTGSHELSPIYLENMTRTRLRPFRPLLYRLYLALLHSGYVGLRSWRLALFAGARGKQAATALRRGHRAALFGIVEEPRG